jgi:hypothetical protein
MRSMMGLGLAALTMMTGCRGMLFPLLLATRIAATAVVVAASQPRVVVVESPRPVPEPPEVYYSSGYGMPPPPPPPPSVTPPPPPGASSPMQRFDAAGAHAELNAIDPSACWPAGTVHGYGKARVTFAPNGTVELVEITNPVQGTPPDSACVSEKYGSASVPPFGGSSVAVYATFYVR